MSHTHSDRSELVDAATVHAARERIVRTLGPLAARPLDEEAAEQMRLALDSNELPAVRAAVRRLARPGDDRPNLVVVTPSMEPAPKRPPETADRSLRDSLTLGGDAA